MSQSLNEIEGLAKKAARGAGRAWGIAEEAGKATRWLESFGLPGGAALAGLLDLTDGIAPDTIAPSGLTRPWHAPAGLLCPLAAGATLTDSADQLAGGAILELQSLSHPVLIAPFVAWSAAYLRQPIGLNWRNVSIQTDGFGVWIDDPYQLVAACDVVTVTCGVTRVQRATFSPPSHRGQIDSSAWDRLANFAARTYAPATEQSRALGAGAGATDND